MIFSSLTLARLAGLLCAATLPLLAQDDDRAAQAALVAKAWVAEIDAGNYEQSYDDAGSALHQKVPVDTWIKILKTERPTLGKVVAREETSTSYKPNGFEGIDGEFMVVSYRTAFENKPHELEYVVLRREGGKWRATGYDFGPEEVVNDPDAGPTTTTTTETQTPPTPPPPSPTSAKSTNP
jgi:hypothetical protein